MANGGREFLKAELIPSPAPVIKGRLPESASLTGLTFFSARDNMFTVSLNRKNGHCRYLP